MFTTCQLILKSVNILGLEVKDISQLSKHNLSQILQKIVTKNWPGTYEKLCICLQELFIENFSVDNLVDFKKISDTDSVEICKVILLVLYLSLFHDDNFRQKFMQSPNLDLETENQLKYILQELLSWQKLFTIEDKCNYLDELMMENLENIPNASDNSSTMKGLCWTPISTTYSNSPKTSYQSPLKKYFQSPQFGNERRIFKQTQETKKRIKELQERNAFLEEEFSKLQTTNKDFKSSQTKLEREIRILKEERSKLEEVTSTLKIKVSEEEIERIKQVTQLSREMKALKSDGEASDIKISNLEDCNTDLQNKLSNLHSKLCLTEAERDRLHQSVRELGLRCAENDSIIEKQEIDLAEFTRQLEELQSFLQERQPNKVFEMSLGSPPAAMNIDEGENMGKAVELKLAEAEECNDMLVVENNDLKTQILCLQDQFKTQNFEFSQTKDLLAKKQEELNLCQCAKDKISLESSETIKRLQEELSRKMEKGELDKKKCIADVKATYKTEVEDIIRKVKKQDKEAEVILKENALLKQKYDISKRKIKEQVEKINEMSSNRSVYESQIQKLHDTINSMSKKKQDEINEIDAAVKQKCIKFQEQLQAKEVTCKRLAEENRSLTTQLQHASTSLRELKKNTTLAACISESSNVRSNSSIVRSDSSNVKSNSSTVRSDSSNQFLRPRPSLTRSSTTRLSTIAPKQELQTSSSFSALNNSKSKAKSVSYLQPPKPSARPKKVMEDSGSSLSNIKEKQVLAERTGQNVLERESFGRSVPKTMVSMFSCEDEEDTVCFNDPKHLQSLKEGKLNLDASYDWRRVSELQRRNTLCPPHMRSAYPAEMQFISPNAFTDDQLREGQATNDEEFIDLAIAAKHMDLNSSPAHNLRKRKSSIDSQSSITSSGGKRSKRLSTSYSRPGPPTPGRRGSGRSSKENINKFSLTSKDSRLSLLSHHTPLLENYDPPATSDRSSLSSPSALALRSGRGLSSANSRRGIRTPSSIKQIMTRMRSPWRKLPDDADSDNKGLGDSAGSTNSSKLKIFRRPFGGKYNVLSASMRAQDEELHPENLTNGHGRVLRHSLIENTPTTRRSIKKH